MRFQNGQWLMREGVGCFAPAHIWSARLEVQEEEGRRFEELCLFAPTSRIRHKGDTLGGIVLELRISAPAPGMIRLRTVPFRGEKDSGVHFDLNFKDEGTLDWTETEEEFQVRSGELSLHVNKDNARLDFKHNGRIITSSSGRDLAYMKEEWKGFAYNRHEKGTSFMRQQLDLAVGEKIYGLGERFTPFVKNGQCVTIWNEDGGTSTDQSYKNIPFYISSEGYGLLLNDPGKAEFEIATENVSKIAFSVPGECLDIIFIDGPDPKTVLERYTDLSGKPALPAPWSFGLWLSTSFTTDYDEGTVMHFIDGMLDRGIPLSVFHFDCAWMKEFHWMDFTWDKEKFPEPEKMLKTIHDKNIKVCVWINPYVGQASAAFDVGKEKGYFLKREDGSVWQWDMWQPGTAIVDFTNPEAAAWYKEELGKLVDMGVDCFKTDFGERIPTDCVYYNQADPEKMHNYYAYLYNKVVYELLCEKKGKEDALLFARSASVGGQKFPVHWGGDCWSNYPSMAESLRGGLLLTSSGFGFWSHDIGGFEDQSTADVYKRWAAFGLLSTHSRFHGSTSYRVPWLYDEEAVDVVRCFARLKYKLLPYLYSSAVYTAESGIPMMRAMFLEYPDDPACAYLDRQYFLGDSLLAAPVFNEEGRSTVYLPEGRWQHYLSGEKAELSHGQYVYSKEDYFSLPLWVKANSLIPVLRDYADCEIADFSRSYGEDLACEVYLLTEPRTLSIYEKGRKLTTLSLEPEDEKIRLQFDGPVCPVIFKSERVELLSGAARVEKEGEDFVVYPESEELIILRRAAE